MTESLDWDELVRLLHYDPNTGVFTWKVRRGRIPIGAHAGCLDGEGYVKISVHDIRYRAHRLAWLYIYRRFPSAPLDHINGIRSDNRISNLREASVQTNARNMRRRGSNTSGFCGVHFHKHAQRWVARIKVDGKYIALGLYDDKADAIQARKKANRKYGFHPNHGAHLPIERKE